MAFIKYTDGRVNVVDRFPQFEETFFKCSCESNRHLIKTVFDKDTNQLHLFILLQKFRFFKRLKLGIRYILGLDGSGHFDDFILQDQDISYLRNVLEKMEKLRSVKFNTVPDRIDEEISNCIECPYNNPGEGYGFSECDKLNLRNLPISGIPPECNLESIYIKIKRKSL